MPVKPSYKALCYPNMTVITTLLAGSINHQLEKLHCTLKTACRIIYIIYKLDKYDHVTKHMELLHWMLYPERINYKKALLMYKCKKQHGTCLIVTIVHFDPKSNSDRQHRPCYEDTAVTLRYKMNKTQNASFSNKRTKNMECPPIWPP